MLKSGSKFENVDVIGVLRKIMENNTEHYQSDFDYDVKMLEHAAADPKGGRSFLWLSRQNGTWGFPDRDVYVRNTFANHSWQFYEGSTSENVKAFWVELDGKADGVIKGNIVELMYEEHVADVRKNSLSADAVEIVFKHPNSVRTFDIVEYNENLSAIINRYGAIDNTEYKVPDENALMHMVDETRRYCFEKGRLNNIDCYIDDIVERRFRNYGYTKGGMTFTTPKDADNALRYGLPVFALHCDNTETLITQHKEIADHVYAYGYFGMSKETKSFLGYLTAVQPDKAPFTKDELDLLYRSVVFAGEGNEALTAGELKHMESLMFKLDTILNRPGEQAAQIMREQEHTSDPAIMRIKNSMEFQQKLTDALLEEACRQWCCFVDEAPERLDGVGFSNFYREICEQKTDEYAEMFLDEILDEAETPSGRYEPDSQYYENGMEV